MKNEHVNKATKSVLRPHKLNQDLEQRITSSKYKGRHDGTAIQKRRDSDREKAGILDKVITD